MVLKEGRNWWRAVECAHLHTQVDAHPSVLHFEAARNMLWVGEYSDLPAQIDEGLSDDQAAPSAGAAGNKGAYRPVKEGGSMGGNARNGLNGRQTPENAAATDVTDRPSVTRLTPRTFTLRHSHVFLNTHNRILSVRLPFTTLYLLFEFALFLSIKFVLVALDLVSVALRPTVLFRFPPSPLLSLASWIAGFEVNAAGELSAIGQGLGY